MTTEFIPTPRDVAVYDTTPAEAAVVLCCAEAAVADLALRHVDGLFDFTDVVNAALQSGTGRTLPELARRLVMRFAAGDAETWFAPLEWTFAVQWAASDETFTVAVPDLEAPGVVAVDDPAAEVPAPVTPTGYQPDPYQVRVRLAGERFAVTDRRVRAAFDEVLWAFESGTVRYQAVSEALRGDYQRAWAMGAADCVVAGQVLTDRVRAAGVEARSRRGYLLGVVATDHVSCEVLLDGQWRCLDPVFALLGGEHGRDRGAEFREACVGSRFNRLLPCAVDGSAPLFLRTDGTPAPPRAFSVSARLHRTVAAAGGVTA